MQMLSKFFWSVLQYSNVNESSALFKQLVKLDFTNFNTQANSDWVGVYDGSSSNAPMLARLSGQYNPAPTNYTTTQHHMFIRFTSNEQISLQGWRAIYTSLPPAK